MPLRFVKSVDRAFTSRGQEDHGRNWKPVRDGGRGVFCGVEGGKGGSVSA